MYKYQILADSIREDITAGNYKPGEKLPSIQALKKESGYNSDTVIKAFKLLEEEHLIYSASRSGFYVVKTRYGNVKSEEKLDFITVRPPDSIHPFKDFYHCMEKSITIYKNKLLEYDTPQGMEELRNALVKHLMNYHIFTRSQDIYITNGAQQALYILSVMPFPGRGRKVVVEQPTYSVMLSLLHSNNIPVVGVGRTEEGLDLKELEEVFKQGDIKFFYIMPRYQNPSGLCYNKEEKQAILQVADRYGVYIVEDDYLADLETEEREDSLYAMGEKERIIYVKSFSKTLLPGLRLGMTILPDNLKENFKMYKRNMDLNTPVLTQGALEIYLRSSMYGAHVKRTRRFYCNRMKALKEACEKILQDTVKFHVPKSGLYALIETDGVVSDRVVNRLKECNILVSHVKNSYLADYQQKIEGIRICVCNCKEEDFLYLLQLIKAEITRNKKSHISISKP